MDTITVNDVSLAVEEAGAGPPVVFVHGSWSDRHAWDLVTPSLADRYRVITYDRRGHSQSERPHGTQDVEHHAADLAALVDHLDAGPTHIVANSFGGIVALTVAARHPGRVASLCLHEPPMFGLADDPGFRDALEELHRREQQVIDQITSGNHQGAARTFVEELALGRGAWDLLPEQVHRTMTHNAPTFLSDVDGTRRAPVDPDELRGVTVPTLLTAGGGSPADTPFGAILERLAAALPHAERYTFEEAGHVPHRTHPGELARVIDDFLGRTSDIPVTQGADPGTG